MKAKDIPWALPPIDPLGFDDDARMIADVLRVALVEIVGERAAHARTKAQLHNLQREFRRFRERLL